jgi:hypothetical protein
VTIPRDLAGEDLVEALAEPAYRPMRQKGSHVRQTTTMGVEHYLTVRNHNPLRIGTSPVILDGVAQHHRISGDELIRLIVG